MEITGYELFTLPPRWLFLRLDTDAGVTGWGEPVVEGKVETVRAAVSELVDQYVLNADPLRIEDLWQRMYRSEFYHGGPILMSAISGIDQALWDIKGKHHDVPVYDLLGGRVRDRIRVFQWVGGDRPGDVADEAAKLVDAGYDALKMDATVPLTHVETPDTVQSVVERVKRVREEVGQSVDIALDFRGRVSTAMADRLLNRLEPLEPLFAEEPVLPKHESSLPQLASGTTTPLASGERRYTRWDYQPLFEDDAVDVIQPNLSHAGGITETRKIAAMGAALDMALSPNCPTGPLTLAASLQVDACTPNFFIQDHGYENRQAGGSMQVYTRNDDIFDIKNGYVEIPEAPGLGVKIDREAIEMQDQEHIEWHSPVWEHNDGSVAHW